MNKLTQRILIIGSGLLGNGLNSAFLRAGFQTRITLRSDGQNTSNIKKHTNLIILRKAHGIICDNLADYERLVSEFKPMWIVNTIPQPSTELVNFLLSVPNCFKFDFSSPAADFALMCPDKCPPGSYPGDKLTVERTVNKRGREHGDAMVLQIGFIPQIGSIDKLPIVSGLSFDTMLMCNLLTGFYDDDISKLDEMGALREFLDKYPLNKGFVCTDITSITSLLSDIIKGDLKIPVDAYGRTLALHSSQVWQRDVIVEALKNPEFHNPGPEFYGQKGHDKITRPVKEFHATFPGYYVGHDNIKMAITSSAALFKNPENREVLIRIAIEKAESELKKVKIN